MHEKFQFPDHDLTQSGELNAVPWHGPHARDQFAAQLALAMSDASQAGSAACHIEKCQSSGLTMPTPSDSPPHNFPIVCVGGSAGGLDAYIRLLEKLPADMGVAIVIVNHITTMPTQLHEVLPRFTTMPVALITEGMQVRPNWLFIIPENRNLHVLHAKFRLQPISKPRGWPDVITVFLRSLTNCWDGKLIAVIVSGYDGDGAAALCGIKAVGGITIAQKPDTAKRPDMPESAIATGCIDFVLSPEEIAQKIVQIARCEN